MEASQGVRKPVGLETCDKESHPGLLTLTGQLMIYSRILLTQSLEKITAFNMIM
jgi:hypothetical protein